MICDPTEKFCDVLWLNQISSQLRNYVASTQQSSHSDAGMALAQGNSQTLLSRSASPNGFFVPRPDHQLSAPCQRGGGAGAYAHTGAGTSGQGGVPLA